MRRQLSLFVYALVGCRLAQAADLAPMPLESLLANSPFGQQLVESSSSTSAIPLELRGVIVDNGEVFFSVFDFASRSSRWVGLNELGNPFTVRGYDKDKNEVKVDYQGRELRLVLKQSTLIALAPPPISAAAPSTNAVQPQATVAPVPTSDEAVRLAQIAEEISRRRALRAQAKLQSNPGQRPAASPK